MRKCKKALVIIIIILLIVLGFSKKSNAYSEWLNPFDNLRLDGNWYCIDQAQSLHPTAIRYDQIGEYTITGNTCNGISADINAKLAYILNQKVTKNPPGTTAAYLSMYPPQVALWLRLRSWYDIVGYKLNRGLSSLIGAPSYGEVDYYRTEEEKPQINY